MNCSLTLRFGVLALLGVSGGLSAGQDFSLKAPDAARSHVTFVAESVRAQSGHFTSLHLHFHIRPGFHINSHQPKSEFLLPTNLTLEPLHGVVADAVVYPVGAPFSFSFDPKEKLEVYVGDITLTTRIRASQGQHTLKGTLHYQACSQTACFPPKTLAIEVPITVD